MMMSSARVVGLGEFERSGFPLGQQIGQPGQVRQFIDETHTTDFAVAIFRYGFSTALAAYPLRHDVMSVRVERFKHIRGFDLNPSQIANPATLTPSTIQL